MRGIAVRVMSAPRPGLSPQTLQTLAQSFAAVGALLLVTLGLSDGVSPSWPLWTIAGVLALGLLSAPLALLTDHRPRRRFAQPAAAFVALIVVGFGLPDTHPSWALSPLWIVACLLGSGLAAEPLIHLANRRPTWESIQPVAALAAILVLIGNLSADGTFFYTASPRTLHSVEELPLTTLRIVIVLLGLSLVATVLFRRRTARGFWTTAATLAALVILLVTLASPPGNGLNPAWPLWSAAGILGLYLGTALVRWIRSLPRARVLAERVDELSRTRSGVLDVQATELRRIERDLHDGAQVRLVALSLKLGRAEDLHRDDPKTAALLREAREDAAAAIRELRELARGISPPVLANRGLDAALRSVAQRSGVEVIVSSTLKRRPAPAVERAAYFVVAESLTNVAKHATGARVEINVLQRGRKLLVEITDFGPGGTDPTGDGLTGLRQRVEALDGVLNVTSRPGVGTKIQAIMPCER